MSTHTSPFKFRCSSPPKPVNAERKNEQKRKLISMPSSTTCNVKEQSFSLLFQTIVNRRELFMKTNKMFERNNCSAN